MGGTGQGRMQEVSAEWMGGFLLWLFGWALLWGGALLWGRGFMGVVYYNGTQSLATAPPQLSALSGIISASRLAPLISGFPFSQQ